MIKKIFTTIFIIFIYRLCLQIHAPGIESAMFEDHSNAASNFNMLAFFTKISGGKPNSIFVLGIGPYILTSIFIQLLFMSFDSLKQYKASHPLLINQLTRILSIFTTIFQLYSPNPQRNLLGLPFESSLDKSIFILSIITGSVIAMWLSEKISEQKIGNGTSIIIFSTIIATIPQVFSSLYNKIETGIVTSYVGIIEMCGFVLCLVLIIYCESAIRKIYVMHSSQQNKYSQDNFIPIKLNPSGILPIIFTKIFLGIFLSYVIQFLTSKFESLSPLSYYLAPSQIPYMLLEISILAFMTYTFTSVIFEGKVIAQNLQKQNIYIKGIKPGKNTENYLNMVINNMNIVSILYIALIVIILPNILIQNLLSEYILQGTSLLILVSVVIDSFTQFQNNQLDTQYSRVKQKIKFIR